jgi:recA bacterial DNA recombination protein
VGATNKIDYVTSRCRNPRGLSRPSRSAPAGSIVDLRKLLAERFPHPFSPSLAVLQTGLSFLDQIGGGGLPKSAITELISPKRSAGSASLVHQLLRAAQRDQHFVALIDGSDSFDPGSSDNSALRHLFWVRCRKAFDAVKATDLLLRDGNFPLVIVDLVLNSIEELRKIPQTSWYRLQRLVEGAPTACLIINRQSVVASAQLKIVLENSWTLEALEKENAISNLRFRIQRSHLNRLENVAAN